MDSRNKIKIVIETIKEQSDISAKDEILSFTNITNDNIAEIPIEEIKSILAKLEKDEEIINVVSYANTTYQQYKMNMDPYQTKLNPYFKIKVTSKFISYYNKLITKRQNLPTESDTNELNIEDTSSITISYNEITRQIVINTEIIVKELRYDSENEKVIKYLVNNPNRKYTIKELESAINSKVNKTFKKIVENFGIPSNLGRLFFSYNKNSIKLNNPLKFKQINNNTK